MLVVRLNSTLALVKVRHENASFAPPMQAPSGVRSARAGGTARSTATDKSPSSSKSGSYSTPVTPSTRARLEPLNVDMSYNGRDDAPKSSHGASSPKHFPDPAPKTPEARRTQRRSSAAPETPGGARDRRRAATEEPSRWDSSPPPRSPAVGSVERSVTPELLSVRPR
jgi:hypothetical protein